MAKNTVVIAGGAGFIGSHLCAEYLKKNMRVVCVDNLSTGAKRNVEPFMDDPNFVFVECDIVEPLPDSVTAIKPEIVINMASPASPPRYQKLAKETLLVGSIGTINLLELASSAGARFFQASTSEVYGDPEVHPQTENYWGNVNSYGPRSMYDESKRFSEAAVYVYKNQRGLNTAVGRIFNTYGPKMEADDGRVVSNLVVQAITNKPMTIYGEGNQTRSFCYVDDLVRGIIALIESGEEGPINLGNPNEFTILELASLVKKMTGTKSEMEYKPLPGDDPMQRKPDISAAQEKLGWQPSIQLEEGLKKTIEYFQSVIDAK